MCARKKYWWLAFGGRGCLFSLYCLRRLPSHIDLSETDNNEEGIEKFSINASGEQRTIINAFHKKSLLAIDCLLFGINTPRNV